MLGICLLNILPTSNLHKQVTLVYPFHCETVTLWGTGPIFIGPVLPEPAEPTTNVVVIISGITFSSSSSFFLLLGSLLFFRKEFSYGFEILHAALIYQNNLKILPLTTQGELNISHRRGCHSFRTIWQLLKIPPYCPTSNWNTIRLLGGQ